MRCVWSVTAAVLASAIPIAGFALPARADIASDMRIPGVLPERVLLFSGFDLWQGGGSGYAGFLWAPKGLAKDGFVAKLISGSAGYRYFSGTRSIRAIGVFTTAMAGARLSRSDFEARFYVGADFQNHWPFAWDPANQLKGFHYGVRLAVETWYQPTPNTMISTSASWASIGPIYSIRSASGYRPFGMAFIGPEAEIAFNGRSFHEYRVGAHITGLRLGSLEWNIGLGVQRTTDRHSGFYGRAGVLVRY